MSSIETWLTLEQASSHYGKSISTIRRWVNLNPTVRTHLNRRIRYIHKDDLDTLAGKHPAAIDPVARAACAEARHLPDPEAVIALGLGGTVEWMTLGDAGRYTTRSKSTLSLWIRNGEIRSVRCTCTWRRFVWTPDLTAAHHNHEHRKGTRRDHE